MRWSITISLLVCVVCFCKQSYSREHNTFWNRILDLFTCEEGESCSPASKCHYHGDHSMATCLSGLFIGVCCKEMNPVEKVLHLTGLNKVYPSVESNSSRSPSTIKGKSATRPNDQYPSAKKTAVKTSRRFDSQYSKSSNSGRVEECGKRKINIKSRKKRIVNGTDTDFGEFPWQVLLRLQKENCGATILNSWWIITAAHCVYKDEAQTISVVLGEHHVKRWNNYYPIRHARVKKIITHPKFDVVTYEYDLSLLKLERPISFAPHIQPICLPKEGADHYGRYGVATGWGLLYPDGWSPPLLQKVTLPIIDADNCEKMFLRAGRREDLPSIFFCAGYKAGQKDTCNGDSGGPMQIKEDDIYYLVGVMSWGIGCAEPNKPGVYIKVSEFVPWIEDVLKEE